MVAAIQGVYFLFAGIWPALSIRSFMAATGEKTDKWLVQTVGVLVAIVGVVLCLAGWRDAFSPEVLTLAIGTALGLGAVDVILWFDAPLGQSTSAMPWPSW